MASAIFSPGIFCSSAASMPFSLAEIYDADIEKGAQVAYAREYEAFGLQAWRS